MNTQLNVLSSTVAPSPREKGCLHERAYPGLDAFYCPSCRKSIPVRYFLEVNHGSRL